VDDMPGVDSGVRDVGRAVHQRGPCDGESIGCAPMRRGENRGLITEAKGVIRSLNVKTAHRNRPQNWGERSPRFHITSIRGGPRGATFAAQTSGFSIGNSLLVM
jgi:hypothetical protein